MKVLVIGGSGLIGRKTIIHLLKDKDVSLAVSMDISPPPLWFKRAIENQSDKFNFIQGDVSQIEDILKVIKQFSIDRLVNFAFVMQPALNENPRLAVKVNALGMNNAFEAARIMGISRVIFASSETVYGKQSDYGDREVTEDDRLYPSQYSYALCKSLAEVIAGQYSQLYGMSFTAIRPAIVYGYGGLSPFIVKWFSDIACVPALGKPFSIEADGKALFSLVSADDVAEFTRLLIHSPSSRHPAYNLGGPPTSLREVADTVRKYVPEAKFDFGSKPVGSPGGSGGGLPWKYSSARAKEDFGFSLMPLKRAIIIHINDARFDAGMAPIKPSD